MNCTAVEAKTSCPELEEVTSCDVMTEETAGTVSGVEKTVPSEEVQSNRSSPAKKTTCVSQVRTVQKSQKSKEHQVDLDSQSATTAGSEEETSADYVKPVTSARGRRGKPAIQLLKDAPVQSPVRKSSRGRISKEQVKSCASAEDEQVALKPRRGRKAEHDIEVLQVGLVTDLKVSVEVEALKKPLVPARPKRGRKGKQEPEAVPEDSIEVGVAPESAEIQPSAETGSPVKSNTRARRGRGRPRKEPSTFADVKETTDSKTTDAEVQVKAVALEDSKIESTSENQDSLKSTTKNKRGRLTKKEMLKTSKAKESSKPNQSVVESDGQHSDSEVTLAVVQPKLSQIIKETEGLVKPSSKTRRGRATPKAAQAEETLKPTSDSEVLPEEPTQIPVVKSRRGRRVNPVALNNQTVADEFNIGPHVVKSQPKPEAPLVRSSRGARNKQLKLLLEDTDNDPAPETIASTTGITKEPTQEPMVKNVKRPKQPKAQVSHGSQEEVQDKANIDSEAIGQSDVPAYRSSRGKRTATLKEEQEPSVKRSRRAATVEVPPPVVKPSQGRKAVAKSEPEEATIVLEPVEEASKETKVLQPVTDSERVAVSSEMIPKRGRGKMVKKSKVSTKDTPVNQAEVAVEEPQLKSKKKKEPEAEDDSAAKLSVLPSVRGRKGRGAQKPGEPEKIKPSVEEKVQPVRRGRAGTSVVSHHDEGAKCPKRGQKRKDINNVAEEGAEMESLPKTKRGRGVGAKSLTDVAGPSKGRSTSVKEVEELSEVNADEPLKKEEKPVRGRRKATREDVLPQDEDAASGTLFSSFI